MSKRIPRLAVEGGRWDTHGIVKTMHERGNAIVVAKRSGGVGELRRAICLLLAAVVAAWAPAAAARPQQPPSLNEDIAKGLRDNRAVPWAVSRPLKWSDFEAVPPESPGQQGAVTGYSLFHGARCTGRRFEFKVVTAFLPGQSWVRPIVLGDPSKSVSALRHEQTHFDLAEVSARRMRRRFADLTNPCRETPEAMEAIAAAFVNDDVAAQARYDEETRHGLRADRQRQWDADTAELLTSLAKFDGKS